MSIEDSVKSMVEESVKAHTLPLVQRLQQNNSMLEQKLNWAEKKLNETMELLRNRNMQIEDRELSGDKIDGGVITNFESTGIKDSSNIMPGHGGMFDRFDGMLGASIFLLVIEALVEFPPVTVVQ